MRDGVHRFGPRGLARCVDCVEGGGGDSAVRRHAHNPRHALIHGSSAVPAAIPLPSLSASLWVRLLPGAPLTPSRQPPFRPRSNPPNGHCHHHHPTHARTHTASSSATSLVVPPLLCSTPARRCVAHSSVGATPHWAGETTRTGEGGRCCCSPAPCLSHCLGWPPLHGALVGALRPLVGGRACTRAPMGPLVSAPGLLASLSVPRPAVLRQRTPAQLMRTAHPSRGDGGERRACGTSTHAVTAAVVPTRFPWSLACSVPASLSARRSTLRGADGRSANQNCTEDALLCAVAVPLVVV
ncbi:PIF1-like helicase, putative [Leishmania donovani]|uniref:PIF1-like helicase, putative n=1 Tax=Leishmania donovani TaxID=5661 RepID=A0A3Q8I7P2_LEIDO|nr:PIF1-like helicase, putative [Leishmania donovani]AYU76660.1 PIF1-like helicase, putative [Leishmania donovani]AYU76662.1 PIF1-like helicase, putative [Leishmania donovani]